MKNVISAVLLSSFLIAVGAVGGGCQTVQPAEDSNVTAAESASEEATVSAVQGCCRLILNMAPHTVTCRRTTDTICKNYKKPGTHDVDFFQGKQCSEVNRCP